MDLYIYISDSTISFSIEFFKKHNVAVMTVKELFDFITDATINEDNMDEYLDTVQENKEQKADQESNLQEQVEEQVEEQVFKQAYIPQTLTQVSLITLQYTEECNL